MNIYLEAEVYEQLREQAFRDKISMSDIIRHSISTAIPAIEKLMDKDPEPSSKDGKILQQLASDVEQQESLLYDFPKKINSTKDVKKVLKKDSPYCPHYILKGGRCGACPKGIAK